MTESFGGKGKTLRHYLDKGLEVWSKKKNQRLLSAAGNVMKTASTIRKNPTNVLEIGASLFKLTSQVLELYEVSENKVNKSKVWKRFYEEKEGSQTLFYGHIVSILTLYIDIKDIKIIESEEEFSRVESLHLPENSTGKGQRKETLLCSMDTPEGPVYWVYSNGGNSALICSKEMDTVACLEFIGNKVWEKFNGQIDLGLSEDNRYFELSPKKEMQWGYEGEQGKLLIERWLKFYSQGIRRSVILHGPPGTGKSTLARQVANEVRAKTLFIPNNTLRKIVNQRYVMQMIWALRPEVLILDDVDRIPSSRIGTFLSFFEETENQVPLLLATTNHLSKLPDALKRPGRFDEIWGIRPPKGEIRNRVIQYLAELEGLNLNEEQAQKLSEIGRELNLPGAHIREIIRRVKVMGWDETEFSEEDLTFRPEWIDLKDSVDILPGDNNVLVEAIEDYDGYDEYDDFDEDLTDYLDSEFFDD